MTGNSGLSVNQPTVWKVNQNGIYWIANQAASGSSANGTYISYQGAASPGVTCLGASTQQRTVEDAGIRAGEIIGYRAWQLENGLLRSMYMYHIWTPKGIERHMTNLRDRSNDGFHAFKDIYHAKSEYWTNYVPIVLGQVALWGTVIEHDFGYRAEFAKITKLEMISREGGYLKRLMYGSQIDILRRKYGV